MPDDIWYEMRISYANVMQLVEKEVFTKIEGISILSYNFNT